ncbi:hypothetical protein MC52_001430 [Klebsiella michiganensis]|nr:hypothetical protein MC52_001430 [Klebsiella michiganensis]
MAKNVKEKKKVKAITLSIYVCINCVFPFVVGLLGDEFCDELIVRLIHKKRYAIVTIVKVCVLNPDIKKKIRLNSIHTGAKFNAVMIYLFFIFLLLDITIGMVDIIYRAIINAMKRETVVIILPGVTDINSVGMPK